METEAGLIAILGHETARWGRFWDCALSMDRPPGTSIAKAYGIDVPHALNLMFEKAEAEGADWVWFIDDDHSFPPEFLRDLRRARQTASLQTSCSRSC